MSNMLKEKRAEFVARLDALKAARQAEIDAKVIAFRESLEASTPKDEIVKVSNVIAALDEVIGYESEKHCQSAPVYRQTQDTTASADETESAHQSAQGRPGMATIFTPTR